MPRIDVLHQYGAKRHYAPIRRLEETNHDYALNFYELSMTANIRRIPRNLSYLSKGVIGAISGRTIILGVEAYDFRIPILSNLTSNNDIIYHTSWPYWSDNRVLRKKIYPGQKRHWQKLLHNSQIITVTAAAKSALEDQGFSATHIPHSVNIDVYSPNAAENRTDNPVVLFVGRLEERKGVHDILSQIKPDDDIEYWFVGDGPLSETIRECEDRLPIEYFGYVGSDEDLASIYADADVLVLPSHKSDTWEELFGIVLIESMACGTPAIATDCVGPREIIDEGETGYLISEGDIDALRDRIQLILFDDELRATLSTNARTVAKQEYSHSLIAEQWAKIIENNE